MQYLTGAILHNLKSMSKIKVIMNPKEHEVCELLTTYKELPILWQTSHPEYNNRRKRKEAYSSLVDKLQKYNPEIDDDYIRCKINCLRSSFRKERRKILKSMETTINADDVHKPSLWYYDLLLFTVGEDSDGQDVNMEEENNSFLEDNVEIRELINGLKQLPVLWQINHPYYQNKTERSLAYMNLAKKCQTHCPDANEDSVKNKLDELLDSFQQERQKVLATEINSDNIYKPTIWYYNLLLFTVEEQPEEEQHSNDNERNSSEENVQNNGINRIGYAPIEQEIYTRELLTSYKNLPILWQTSHPQYNNRQERHDAYDIIARNLQKYNPEADEDHIRAKINSLRTTFRRERRKIRQCKESGIEYKTSLWYYNLLLFTVGEEPEEVEDDEGLSSGNNQKFDHHKYAISRSSTKEHEFYIRELLTSYRQMPILWQQSHPNYNNRQERNEGYSVLAKKCQKYIPEADEDFVRAKIDSLRSTFRRERHKVLRSMETQSNKVYRPSLWYYDLLLFTVGEEPEGGDVEMEEEQDDLSENSKLVGLPFWKKEYSTILINLYKCHPCLYSSSHPGCKSKRQRMMALKKITQNMEQASGKKFLLKDIRRKITLLRGQYLHEYKKTINSEDNSYKSSLWCYKMLDFLQKEYSDRKNQNYEIHINASEKSCDKNSPFEDSDEDLNIKHESNSSHSSGNIQLEFHEISEIPQNDDIYDTIANNLAYKLRDMTEEQREIANKIIRDVMYHGQMENLTSNSRLSINGV